MLTRYLCVSAVVFSFIFGPIQASDTPPQKKRSWRLIGSLRSRVETWDWFDPGNPSVGKENTYSFMGNYFRLGVAYQGKRLEFLAEADVPLVFATPKDAIAPAPQGQLGLGAAYRAANADRVAYIFPRQAYVTFKGVGEENTNLRLGRFEFVEGIESMTQDATLDWIKRERIGHRLIGNFAFSHVQRTADGVQLFRNFNGTNFTVVAARPTVGVFELNGNPDIPSVEYVYAGLTHTGARKDYDARLFYVFYRDGRNLLKTDSRPLPVRRIDTAPLNISTIGGHYTRKIGPVDLLGWGAWQWGDWGAQTQRSWAWVAEIGYQPKLPLKPWLRGGSNRASGDGNSGDDRHETFFQILPTPRIYARFPFFNMMNTDDNFVQAMVRPGSRTTIRSDFRWLRLDQAADLWYSGGGAFQKQTFGFTGRPSGGSRDLGQLVDASIDYRLTAKSTVTFYYGHASGGRVISTIYPAGPTGNLLFWELSHRF